MGQPSNVAPFKKPDTTVPPAAAKPRGRKFLRQHELVERVQAPHAHQVNALANLGHVLEVVRPASIDLADRNLPLCLVNDFFSEFFHQTLE